MLREYKLSEIEYLKVNGRTNDCLEPLTLFWTGSGFELNAKGSELWVELEADYDEQEPWISILINGAHIARQMAVKGKSRICLFRSRNPEEIKHVQFVKDSQAMHDDETCCLQIHSISFDGEFCPIENKPYKLEFVGDSITSGEGIFGAKEELDWVAMFFSGVYSYAALTAKAVDADFRIVSQSGWGVYASWDGQLDRALPLYYEKVCGVLEGERNVALGAQKDYDFTKWQPDAVIINLGTNDGSAFGMPEFHEDIKSFENAVTAFLKKVRRCNPDAEIIWVYGMLGYSMNAPIARAINTYCEETGDKKVHFLQLPNTTKETVGSREHPGIPSHKMAAGILTDYLKNEILK